MHTIEIRHNFESGHRLPHLPGKCQSLHGHSFWATVTIEAATLDNGIIVDYGQAKTYLREWIDTNWDHGLILGLNDDLVSYLVQHGKVCVIDGWPTVEALARHLGLVMEAWCRDLNRAPDRGDRPTIHVRRVHIQETHVNGATWSPEAVLHGRT